MMDDTVENKGTVFSHLKYSFPFAFVFLVPASAAVLFLSVLTSLANYQSLLFQVGVQSY